MTKKEIWTITDESARSLDPGDKGDHIRFDSKFAGFGVHARKLGKDKDKIVRTFIFQFKIGGKTRRMHCGRVGVVSAKQARAVATGHLMTIKGNGDPAADRRALHVREGRTLGAAIEQYLAGATKLRHNTTRVHRGYLQNHWKRFHDRPLDEITPREVSEQLIKIAESSGPAASNRARAVLSVLYVWARQRHMCTTNPTIDTAKQLENDARERQLSDSEIAALWHATDGDGDYAQIVRLLLLTGCRANEIAELKWSEVDLNAKTVTIAKERSKNGNAHLVPLAPEALAILQARPRYSANVFGRGQKGYTGFTPGKKAIDKKLKFAESWTLHDLRRTITTGLQRLGIRLEVTQAVLNHTGAARTGVAGVYHLHDYKEEKRAALEAWNNQIRVILAQASGANVTPLRKA